MVFQTLVVELHLEIMSHFLVTNVPVKQHGSLYQEQEVKAGAGEDVTIKMGSHGGSGDETALIGFGSIPLEGEGGEWKSEGPHGTDAGVSGTINEGSVKLTTPMGIKGISWNIDPAGTQHHEIWINTHSWRG